MTRYAGEFSATFLASSPIGLKSNYKTAKYQASNCNIQSARTECTTQLRMNDIFVGAHDFLYFVCGERIGVNAQLANK
jgi:hypothetical protein